MKGSQETLVFVFGLAFYVVYLLIGAAIFRAIEEENFLLKLKKVKSVRDLVLNKYNISELTQEEESVLSLYYLESYAASYGKWTFGNSFLFCLTTITTIGYGNLVPRTMGGRLFCILYSLIGIPSTCLVLKSVGEQIAGLLSIGITNFEKRCLRRENPWKIKQKTTVATVILTFCVVLPLFTATVMTRRADMTYVECFYFTFVSLSTIGFGDFVPHFKTKTDFVIILEMFFSLAVVSSILCSLNLWIERHADLQNQFKKALNRPLSWKSKVRWSDPAELCEATTKSTTDPQNASQKRRHSQHEATVLADIHHEKESENGTPTLVKCQLEMYDGSKSVATQTDFENGA